MVSFIGKWLFSALGWAMPGLSASSFYLVAGTLVLSLTASVAYIKGSDGKGAAVATERAACEVRTAEDAKANAESLAHLLDRINKADAEAAEPVSKADELAQCRKSKLCRGPK